MSIDLAIPVLDPFLAHARWVWRSQFLTASTWAGVTASDKELIFALQSWTPDLTIEQALAKMKNRRALERRGLLGRQERAAKEAEDD